MHSAVYSDEVFELYCKYQKTIHNDTDEILTKEKMARHLCNSPLYDENVEEETRGKVSAPNDRFDIDKGRSATEDHGVYLKKKGTYFMCHRLDGKLVAVGSLDICKEYVDSAYFIYDPDYKFLNLGIIGALREIEYMRMTGKRWYVLGDMIVNCPKVNYKLQYKPGYVPCPRTKKHVRYDDVKDMIELI